MKIEAIAPCPSDKYPNEWTFAYKEDGVTKKHEDHHTNTFATRQDAKTMMEIFCAPSNETNND